MTTMILTISCTECEWTTDIETTSVGNPSVCPRCQSRATVDGMDLYDSNTAQTVSPDALGITDAQYLDTMIESLTCGTAEGHVALSCGRRVYAA